MRTNRGARWQAISARAPMRTACRARCVATYIHVWHTIELIAICHRHGDGGGGGGRTACVRAVVSIVLDVNYNC